MTTAEQHRLIEQNRAKVLTMLSGRNRTSKLADISSIDGTVDQKLFKTNILDIEAIVDPTISAAIQPGVKQTKTDIVNLQYYNRLLALAEQPEISDILDILLDEMFSYSEKDNTFARLSESAIDKLNLDENISKQVKTALKEAFTKIYGLLKFNDLTVTKEYDVFKIFKLFLILGKMRFFIEYDNLTSPTAVRAIHYLDPRLYNVDRFEREFSDRRMIFYRIQRNSASLSALSSWSSAYEVTTALPAVIVDAQLVDVDWRDIDVNSGISYLAGLERAFNIYRTMERTRIAWAVNTSRFRMKAIVPTKGQGYNKSLQTLRAAIGKYSEKLEFNDDNGTITVNGQPSRSLNQELWMAETTSGTPQFDSINEHGPELQDMGPIMYFWQRFIRTTKIPPSLTDKEQDSFWNNDETRISLEYARFYKYLDRIRRASSAIFVKPVWAEFICNPEYAKLSSDSEIRLAIQVTWSTNDVFRKRLELSILKQTLETIEELTRFKMSADSNLPILSSRLLLKRYTDLTDDELMKHQEQIIADIKETAKLEQELGGLSPSNDDMY